MVSASSKKLLRELPQPWEMENILSRLLGASDHVVALSGMSFLDHALEVFLATYFRPLNAEDRRMMFDGGANGILGTASAKIRMAYALRLIKEPAYQDLLLMNHIRNTFAHTLHTVHFDHELIYEDCAKLQSFRPGILTAIQETPKRRFFFCVLAIYTALQKGVEHRLQAIKKAGEESSEQPS